MSIAALSSTGFTQDVAAPQKVLQPARPTLEQSLPVVDTRDYPAVDRKAALVYDEYEVNSPSNASVSEEEGESEGLSVYA